MEIQRDVEKAEKTPLYGTIEIEDNKEFTMSTKTKPRERGIFYSLLASLLLVTMFATVGILGVVAFM